jgi:hypothetical protein
MFRLRTSDNQKPTEKAFFRGFWLIFRRPMEVSMFSVVLWHPNEQVPPETIKRGSPPPLPIWPLFPTEKHFKIQNLSSLALSQASNPDPLLLREYLSFPLSESPDSSKSTSPSILTISIIFVTLGDSLP